MGVGVGLGLAGVAGGCTGNGEAWLSAPTPLLADSFSSATLSDACVGSKADLCTRENLRSIESIESSNAAALSGISADELPAGLLGFSSEPGAVLLHALAPGKTELCVRGRFSDKSLRKACSEIAVMKPDHVDISLNCDNWLDQGSALSVVAPGAQLPFTAHLMSSDSTELTGVALHPLDETGLTTDRYLGYTWSSPADGGMLELRSRLVPEFRQSLRTFAADEITSIVGAGVPLLAKHPGDLGGGQVTDFIGLTPVCRSAGPKTRSETPDICLGPHGEREWEPRSSQAMFEFTGLAEGTCQLSFALTGTDRYVGSSETHVYKLNPNDDARTANWDDPCPRVGLRTCRFGRDSVQVCRAQDGGVSPRWDTLEECHGICDFTASAADCTDPTGCVACR